MKYFYIFALALFLTNVTFAASNNAPIKVAVPEFKDKAGDNNCRDRSYWHAWKQNLGSAFKEMLTAEVVKRKRFQLLERDRINKMYEEEYNLVNSKEGFRRKRGGFKSADYQLVGAVTQFEYCASDSGAGIDVGRLIGFGSIKVGGKKAKAKVVVELRAIDVNTGVIVASSKGEGFTDDTGFDVDVDVGRLGFDLDHEKNSPLGQASEEAIVAAFADLERKI